MAGENRGLMRFLIIVGLILEMGFFIGHTSVMTDFIDNTGIIDNEALIASGPYIWATIIVFVYWLIFLGMWIVSPLEEALAKATKTAVIQNRIYIPVAYGVSIAILVMIVISEFLIFYNTFQEFQMLGGSGVSFETLTISFFLVLFHLIITGLMTMYV